MSQSLVEQVTVEDQENLASQLQNALDDLEVKDEVDEELTPEEKLRNSRLSAFLQENLENSDNKRVSIVTFEDDDAGDADKEDDEGEAIETEGLTVTGIRTYDDDDEVDNISEIGNENVEKPVMGKSLFNVEDSEDDQPQSNRKRNSQDVSDNEMEETEEAPVATILHKVGTDIKKTMNSKRRKLETYTKQCNASRDKVDRILKEQRDSRACLYEDFYKTADAILKDWQKDLNTSRRCAVKMKSLFDEQLKLSTEIRTKQIKRYNTLKDLHCEFMQSLANMEMSHQREHKQICKAANKEVSDLRKKFLTQSKNQDIATVRKSLQSFID